MPSRMPNWKMRANALVDGMPTTRLCRMPSFGSTCMMRTMRRIDSAVWKLSASSVAAKTYAPPHGGKKVEDFAVLESGWGVPPRIGGWGAALPLRLQGGEPRLLGGGDLRVVG